MFSLRVFIPALFLPLAVGVFTCPGGLNGWDLARKVGSFDAYDVNGNAQVMATRFPYHCVRRMLKSTCDSEPNSWLSTPCRSTSDFYFGCGFAASSMTIAVPGLGNALGNATIESECAFGYPESAAYWYSCETYTLVPGMTQNDLDQNDPLVMCAIPAIYTAPNPPTPAPVAPTPSPVNELQNQHCGDLHLAPSSGEVQWCPAIAGDSLVIDNKVNLHFSFTDIRGHVVVQFYIIGEFHDLFRTIELDETTGNHMELITVAEMAHLSDGFFMRVRTECEVGTDGFCDFRSEVSSHTEIPTSAPSSRPSSVPTSQPSAVPTSKPSSIPTSEPSSQPSSIPTSAPSPVPTSHPSAKPTLAPTSEANMIAYQLSRYEACMVDLSKEKDELCSVRAAALSHVPSLSDLADTLTLLGQALQNLTDASCAT